MLNLTVRTIAARMGRRIWLGACLAAFWVAPAGAGPAAVYTTSNAAAGNSILVFERGNHGALTLAGSVSTGGTGTGAGLGSQAALAMSDNGRWLVAANAGSNDISVFLVTARGLMLRDRKPSGGIRPISVALNDGLVYVVNAGGAPNVSGFWLSERGKLEPIAGSTRPLGGADPAQASLSPDNDFLVVTEKATNTIEVFTLDDGRITGARLSPSHSPTPFGFSFDEGDHLLVTEAVGGAANASVVSSYSIGDLGVLEVITGSLATTQTAACWLAVSKDGRFAYSANTPNGTISSMRISSRGSLMLLKAVAADVGAGSAPSDMSVGRNGRILYSLNPGAGTITGFAIEDDGVLRLRQTASGVPASAAGLAAR